MEGWSMLIGAIVCFVAAAVMLFCPDLLYTLFVGWKLWDDSGEPPKWYLWYMRVGAGFLIAIGVFLLIGHFTA